MSDMITSGPLAGCASGDVQASLTAVSAPKSNLGDELLSALSPAAALLNQVSRYLLSFDPMDEWVVKPLFGDWGQLNAAAQAWQNSGQAVDTLIQNFKSVSARAGEEWEGQAADACMERVREFVQTMDAYPDAAAELAEMLEAVVQAADALGTIITSAIDILTTIAEQIIAALCVPVGGPAAAGAVAGFNSGRVIRTIGKVSKGLDKVEMVIGLLNSAVSAGIAVFSLVKALERLNQPGTGAANFRAGVEAF
ncbi:MAG: WXG100 family type VII secretion target [Bifidobacteriaceae bacterium]|jgi:uncharacterized protein YukE|nr:WXG100 family type VII secretion target [Bifidobacteriaceae bacterium]